ncbi:hypothetical protein LCGC14_0801180 [marine sediment metagenome]|uniref:Uncharacterized protein n=1 Tax=marine sediment metagenome TaxID=412755 RepID=A0A0F9S9J9_9ZZZZ
MRLRYLKKKKITIIFLISFIILLNPLIFTLNSNVFTNLTEFPEKNELEIPKNPTISAQETLTSVWFENPNFQSGTDPWYSEIDGDADDINATYSPEHVNFDILGEVRTFNDISGTPQIGDWTEFNHSVRSLPLTHEINQYGLNVSHAYDEGNGIAPNSGDQTATLAGVLWKRNITMPVDMSDYIITSALVSAIVNGSADPDIETSNDLPIMNGGYASLYDHAFFYAEISDLNNIESHKIAEYQTNDLGTGRVARDSADYSTRVFLNDTFMDPKSESDIIFFLNQIFQLDNYNFTITLGIEIDCEDNYPGFELDYWYSLLIKSINFSFTYEKKIDQFSTASWNQDGDQISDLSNDTIIINEATLNFKYKSDEVWPGSSPNSEIRAFINNIKISETVKLSNANSSFQLAKIGGFDVTSAIPYNTNINLSIQLYIADEFKLDKKISISIDDIYLNITYTVTFPDTQTNLQIFFNGNNKTLNPFYEHPVNEDLNITIKYPDNVGSHISGAVVQLSGNLTGMLTENVILEQYSLIINASELNLGEFRFDVVAHRINYEARKISPILVIKQISTENLQLFLNKEEKTIDPFYEIAINKLLNITIKYRDLSGTHIPGATVQLTGDGILETLNESSTLNQYSIIINTTIKFSLGDNNLVIKAQETEHQEKVINPRIILRRINTEITPVSGSNTINIKPGQSANVSVYIINTDFNSIIKGVIVTYSWGQKNGVLNDTNNDGIYELIISNIPEGTHSINITAFGSNIYNFNSYEIIVTAFNPRENLLLFQILLIIGIVVSVTLGGYLYVYQKYLKFPKAVRKVRKFSKTLKKKNTPNVGVLNRKKAFIITYREVLGKFSRFLKGKQVEHKLIREKPKIDLPRKKPTNNNKPEIEDREKKITPEDTDESTGSKKQQFNQKNHLIKFRARFKSFWNSMIKFKGNYGYFYKIILLIIIILSLPLIIQFMSNTSSLSGKAESNIFIDKLGSAGQQTFTKQWLNNTSFDDPIEPTWFPLIGNLGDKADVNATSTTGQANFEVLGNFSTFSNVSGVPQPGDGWSPYSNSYFITPDYYEISDITGVMANHTYDESVDQSRNRPSIHWRLNVSMPVNMSEYIITSVNLTAIVNGSADTNVETPLDDLSTGGTSTWSYTYHDYARFYVKISNLNYEDLNEVAYYQTVNLGEGDQLHDGSGTLAPTLDDTFMNLIEESRIIYYLTRALEDDNFNFGITLGIDIYTEDNYNDLDLDTFHSLLIKSFNLTFSYEKRMDIFTSVSWNQNADKISGLSNDIVIVDEALLNFNYIIDQDWVDSSPNSELRILINNNQHFETVKLSTANTSFQLAKPGGFDITSLITDDVNVSIQLYLADSFGLNRTITVSIDDVTLEITYTIIFPDKVSSLQLKLNNENRTLNPDFELNVGDQLNLTIKYLNETGNHISNATVLLTGNFFGVLTENVTLEQYFIIFSTDIINIGINFLTITAKAENYELQSITPVITINKLTSDNLQVFLNGENKTLDPNIELIYSEELNVTIKYTDTNGFHIPNATVRLISESITNDLIENSILEHYTTFLNTTDRLRIGVNQLAIEAQDPSYQTGYSLILLSIRKINLEIESTTTKIIEMDAGKDITLSVSLNNTDFGGFVKNAVIWYVWEHGTGTMTDKDNVGIYTTIINDVSNGTYTFEITVLFVGDEYYIEDYEIIVVAIAEPEVNLLFPILFTLSIILAGGLAIYLIAYQTYLKYPRPVRKIRKYRKTLNRKNPPNIVIIDREKSIRRAFNMQTSVTSKIAKSKSLTKEIPERTRKPKIEANIDSEQLIDKSLEKRKELDKLVEKSKNKPKN